MKPASPDEPAIPAPESSVSGPVDPMTSPVARPVRVLIVDTASAFGGTAPAGGTPAAGSAKASDVVSEAAAALEKAKPVRTGPKVGRNDPCPCGSGKKYKHCCGR